MISVKENSDIAHIITGIVFFYTISESIKWRVKKFKVEKTNHHHPIKKTIRTFKRKKTFSFLFHCLKHPTSTPYSDTKPRHPDTAKNFILAFFLIFKIWFCYRSYTRMSAK